MSELERSEKLALFCQQLIQKHPFRWSGCGEIDSEEMEKRMCLCETLDSSVSAEKLHLVYYDTLIKSVVRDTKLNNTAAFQVAYCA